MRGVSDRPQDGPSRQHEPKPVESRVSCEGGRAIHFTSERDHGYCVREVGPAVSCWFGETVMFLTHWVGVDKGVGGRVKRLKQQRPARLRGEVVAVRQQEAHVTPPSTLAFTRSSLQAKPGKVVKGFTTRS
jgi:hypothetical protein